MILDAFSVPLFFIKLVYLIILPFLAQIHHLWGRPSSAAPPCPVLRCGGPSSGGKQCAQVPAEADEVGIYAPTDIAFA